MGIFFKVLKNALHCFFKTSYKFSYPQVYLIIYPANSLTYSRLYIILSYWISPVITSKWICIKQLGKQTEIVFQNKIHM
jgi:hypothetical protein